MTKNTCEIFFGVVGDGSFYINYTEDEMLKQIEDDGEECVRSIRIDVKLSPPTPPQMAKSEIEVTIPDGATEVEVEADEP